MQLTIAVDLAKSVFQVAESRQPGKVSRELRLSRPRFETYLAQLPPARILFEACGSSHYWARRAQALSHVPVLLPPHHTRRYRAGNKTDRADAKAMLEAVRNETIRPVPVKTVEQQSWTSLHRLREGHMATRVARIHAIRGLLREYGITIPVGARKVVPFVHALEPGAVPEPLRIALLEAAAEVQFQEERIQAIERQLQALSQDVPLVQYLLTIPGIGLITATALVAFVGDFRRFPRARSFANYLGLTPREDTSAFRRHLGPISKRGDEYLRRLLVHGARTVLQWAGSAQHPTPLQQWMLRVKEARGYNIATVALANKLARFAWTVTTEQRPFRPNV
jgi:transposase